MVSKRTIFIVITFLFFGLFPETRMNAQVLPSKSVSAAKTTKIVSNKLDPLQTAALEYCQAARTGGQDTIKKLIVDDIPEPETTKKTRNPEEDAPPVSALYEFRRMNLIKEIPATIRSADMKIEEIKTSEKGRTRGVVSIVLRSTKVPSLRPLLVFKLRLSNKFWRIYDVEYLNNEPKKNEN